MTRHDGPGIRLRELLLASNKYSRSRKQLLRSTGRSNRLALVLLVRVTGLAECVYECVLEVGWSIRVELMFEDVLK